MGRDSFSRPLLAWALAAWLVVPASAAEPSDTQASPELIRGKARAMDGDSLRVGRREIRLWGIDAPEFDQSCERDGRTWDCGRAARSALASRIDGRTVECQVRDRDAYRRAVSVCRVAGRATLNEWMVQHGWAVDYRRYSKGAYARAERQARRDHRGIWSGHFEAPERYRHEHRHR
jgi:endonuclease YncB( thermonuclease family)